MKKISLMLVLVLTFMAVSAVAITASAADKVELDFWTFWGSETRRPIVEAIIDNYNNSQDRIHVNHTYLPWGDIWTKNLASIAAGHPADIIINDINSVPLRAVNGQVTEISQYLPDDISEQYYPSLWQTVTYNEGVYGLPFNTDTRILFYNKDAFREAGLDPENPPKTWDELWEYAEKLDKQNGRRYERIGFYPLWGLGMDVWSLNGGGGQGYINYDFEKPVINTLANLETYKWVKKWRDKYGEYTINIWDGYFSGDTPTHPFLTGRLGMIANTATFYTQIRDFAEDMDFGVAPLPEAREGSGHWSWGGGFVAEIPKGSDNVEEAVEFLLYLTGSEASEYWAYKNIDNVANIEGSMNAAKNPELSDKGQEVFQMAADNLNWTVLTPHLLVAPEYWNLVNPEVDAFMMGRKSAEEALYDAQMKVEELIEIEREKME